MIKNSEHFTKHIASWLVQYAKDNDRDTFVVYFSGSVIDAALIHICTEAVRLKGGLSLKVVCTQDRAHDLQTIYPGTPLISADQYEWANTFSSVQALLLGPTTRTELLNREYDKRLTALFDVFPFLDAKYSDIDYIARERWPHIQLHHYDNVLSMERVLDLEDNYRIVSSDEMPDKHERWKFLIHYQKAEVSIAHQREKRTRHKAIVGKPFPILRGLDYIC